MFLFLILFQLIIKNINALPNLDPIDSATREHTIETLELSYKRYII